MQSEATGNYPVASCSAHERYLVDAPLRGCLYIQGGYLYIPTDQTQQKCWGEKSGYRQELQQRNCRIRAARRQGASLEHLAEQYCLSIHAIRKIIYQK